MYLEILPLAVIVLGLLIYLVVRWRYRFTCPNCGHWARKRATISFSYQIDERGKKREVKVPAGFCPTCDHFWTLKNTHVRTQGLIIPKGNMLRR